MRLSTPAVAERRSGYSAHAHAYCRVCVFAVLAPATRGWMRCIMVPVCQTAYPVPRVTLPVCTCMASCGIMDYRMGPASGAATAAHHTKRTRRTNCA